MKNCFNFRLTSTSEIRLPSREEPRIAFRDAGSIYFLDLIVLELQARGFELTAAEPVKGCDASSVVKLPSCTVDIFVGAKRQDDSTEFYLMTRARQTTSRRDTSSSCLCEWTGLCDAINQILSNKLAVDSLQWLTLRDAESLWLNDQNKTR